MKRLILMAAILPLIITACVHFADRGATPVLEGEKWLLAEFDGQTAPFQTVDEAPFIQFGLTDGQFNGFAGCNPYFGKYTVEETGDLSLGPVASTRRYCPEADEEYLYFLALERTASFRIEGKELRLLDKDGGLIARFIRIY